ncbi:MAG: hypothetical protein JWN14_2913 [Chthonomonadales bacterium]|nr:hypothetical protein [Chthonomonadales bacterium]
MFRKISIRAMLFGVVVLGSGLLWGCGGNGSSPTSTGGIGGGGTSGGPGGAGGGTTPQSSSVIKAVMDAADIKFAGIIKSTMDHDARNQQMATWLKSRPEFADAGVTAGTDCAWGRLKNGQLYVATSSFIPGETRAAAPGRSVSSGPAPVVPTVKRSMPNADSSRPAFADSQRGVTRAAAPAPNLPSGLQARVLISLDPNFYDPPNNKIADMLRDHKYTVIQQSATIENLKHVQGDNAFWWGTHGTIAWDSTNQKSFWAVWTANDITDADNVTYKADLDDRSLVFFSAAYKLDADGNSIVKTRYAITYKFIDKYNWTFGKNAFLFMDCCHSDNGAIVRDMGNRPGGVAATYGWSGSVLVSAAWEAGIFAFDRLLGGNQAEPKESVPQRPFDSSEVYFELKDLGMDKGGGDTRLISRVASSIALSPSISYMEMSERIQESPMRGKSKLTLHGIFGDDKGTVKIGGVEVPIDSWATDKIECEPADLPGAGFSGDVQVISHDRPSNAVSLTQWHGKLTYDIDILPSVVSTAHATITADVYFRGDVHKYREFAGRPVLPPKLFNFRASQGSTCHWQVTGNPVPMAAWNAPISADLPFGLNGTVAPPYGTGYIVSGVMDADKGSVKFSFNYLGCGTSYDFPGTPNPPQQVLTLHDQRLTSVGSGVGSDGYVIYANNLPATIGSSDYVIPGVTLTGTTPIYNPKLVLADFIPTYQPEDSKGEDNTH